MIYAEPKILAIYIEREVILPRLKLKTLSETLSRILDSMVMKQSSKAPLQEFKEKLLDCLKDFSRVDKVRCLHALKKFLTSRDFNFPGKYQATSYFFGAFTYYSESGHLKILKNAIENLIHKLSSPDLKTKTLWIETQGELKQLVDRKTHNKTTLIKNDEKVFSKTLWFYFFINLITSGYAKKFSLYDQSAFLPEATPFDSQQTCIPEDELFFYFKVLHNVPMEKVEFFYFGENHSNTTHQKLQEKFILSLGLPGDEIRFESVASNITLPCSTLGVVMRLNLPDSFVCRGWENIEYYNKVAGIADLQQKMEDKLNQVMAEDFFHITKKYNSDYKVRFPSQFINEMKVFINTLLTDLEKVKHYDDEVYKTILEDLVKLKTRCIKAHPKPKIISSIYKKLYVSVMTVIDVFKSTSSLHLEKNLVKERNRQLIKIDSQSKNENKRLKKQGKKPHRFFTVMGSGHLVPLRAEEKDAFFGDIQSTDPQSELRQAIAKKPHAILIPK